MDSTNIDLLALFAEVDADRAANPAKFAAIEAAYDKAPGGKCYVAPLPSVNNDGILETSAPDPHVRNAIACHVDTSGTQERPMHYVYRPNSIEHLYNKAGINIQVTNALKLRV